MGTIVTLIIAGIIIAVGFSRWSGGSKDNAVDEVACRKDLQCMGDKYSNAAGVYCKDSVARLAKYTARWTDGTLDSKFSHFRWLNKEKGTLTFIGDKIEFQNGFGAYQKHIYECDFNPQGNQVLAARAQPGQL